ncbi:hypothetical protein [Nocardia sp. alder85J]|uniref:hypothetical protein n=1 Tax=Nocardia sp. alder85J TaxID=2862949 RepID=UPI001CD40F2F|nr:hypothetical protein [Nocardia sp. alder85J]MCX4095160.1 hypothetical protein [Nocardia sp. alder85J]
MTISLDKYRWESEFALRHQALGRAEGEAVGRAEGEATAILTVLAARGITVDASTRRRISECWDLELLAQWLRRVAIVSTAAELFE